MSIHILLMSLSDRPYLVLAVVFAAACAESFAAIGTFVPAGVVMFVAGALIGAGAVNGWLTMGVAALGAIVGDGLSYELGRRYHDQVGSWWKSHGHEPAWLRGERFVERHGGKSIVFARFFAPVRAVVAQLQRVIDPNAPEFATLAALTLLFVGSVWLFGGVLQDVIADDPLMQVDTALYAFLQSLHIEPMNWLMTGVGVLNSQSVTFAIATVVLVWLVFRRCWKSSAWWITVVGVGIVLSPILAFSSRSSRPLLDGR